MEALHVYSDLYQIAYDLVVCITRYGYLHRAMTLRIVPSSCSLFGFLIYTKQISSYQFYGGVQYYCVLCLPGIRRDIKSNHASISVIQNAALDSRQVW